MNSEQQVEADDARVLEEAARVLEEGRGDLAARTRLLQALRDPGAAAGVVAAPELLRTGRAAEVGGYVGAALVIAAGVVFLSTLYDRLGRGGVSACVLAIGVLLGVVSAAAQTGGGRGDDAGPREAARRRLAGISGYAAALALGTGVALVLGGDPDVATLTGSLVVAAGALLRARTLAWESPAAQVWGIAALGVAIGAGAARLFDDRAALVAGLGVYLLGAAWTAWGVSPRTRERDLACTLGLAAMLVGGEVTAVDLPGAGYPLLAGAAASGLAIDARLQCTAALGLGVAATTVVVPQAVSHYTEGSIGAAGALLVGGMALLGASGIGTGLRRRRAGSGAG